MADAKTISSEVKRMATDAQAAGADFSAAVADDVRHFAKDVARSGSKTGSALHGDIADLQKDVSRIMVSLRKLAAQAAAEIAEGTHDKFDELTAEAHKAGTSAKKSAAGMADDAETMITQHPLASVMIALGLGFCLSQLLRR